VRKILFLKSVQFLIKKNKMSLKFLGHFVLIAKKIWDRLSAPRGYSVLGTLCPKDRSVAGMFPAGALSPRTFCPGTFCPGTFCHGTTKTSADVVSFLQLHITMYCTVYGDIRGVSVNKVDSCNMY
jgi:hypothetical protein